MLVLSRKANESIVISVPGYPPITVTVAEINKRAGKVRLGITAPHEVLVDREEIRERKLAGQQT